MKKGRICLPRTTRRHRLRTIVMGVVVAHIHRYTHYTSLSHTYVYKYVRVYLSLCYCYYIIRRPARTEAPATWAYINLSRILGETSFSFFQRIQKIIITTPTQSYRSRISSRVLGRVRKDVYTADVYTSPRRLKRNRITLQHIYIYYTSMLTHIHTRYKSNNEFFCLAYTVVVDFFSLRISFTFTSQGDFKNRNTHSDGNDTIVYNIIYLRRYWNLSVLGVADEMGTHERMKLTVTISK